MVACTAARESEFRSEECGVLGELTSLWLMVQAVEDIPATPETNLLYQNAKDLLDDCFQDMGLDAPSLRAFFRASEISSVRESLMKLVNYGHQ